MTYTSILQLPLAEAATSITGKAISTFNTDVQLLEEYISGYYYYNISLDADIAITTENNIIDIADTGNILTNNRNLTITSRPTKLMRAIKNSTVYNISYGSITIPPSKIYIIYDNYIISGYKSVSILDLYTYTYGLPSADTILISKRSAVNSILIGGGAKAAVAATSNITIDIWLNTNKVGTIKFSAGSSIGTVSIFGIVYINVLDNLYIKTQSIQDATLADVGIVLNIIGE